MKNQFRETQRRRLLDRAAVPREQILAELSGARFNPPQYDQLLLRELAVAIPRLPPFQRDVLIAVCLQGLSYEQAGAKLGIPVGTIRSRLYRARTALQELLEPYVAAPMPRLRVGLL